MGVRGLWSIIEPIEEHVPLRQLRGQTLAVDLAIWVCGDQQTQERLQSGETTQQFSFRLYLRNLFFRVRRLLQLGVHLVVVVDGIAPEAKLLTMSQRQKDSDKVPDLSRHGFRSVLGQCRCILEALGVVWLQSPAEAESMCALINRLGLVDGCITNDGDAFLYGAAVVYRNFSMSSKDPHVKRYRASRVLNELHLSREQLVCLALMLGCDYFPSGVHGIGRELALRWLKEGSIATSCNCIEQLKCWGAQPPLESGSLQSNLPKKGPHCSACGHTGRAAAHRQSGCSLCDANICPPFACAPLPCTCDYHLAKRLSQETAQVVRARVRALPAQLRPFPPLELLHEFLCNNDSWKVPCLPQPIWSQPSLQKLIEACQAQLSFSPTYTLMKCLPLLARWDMERMAESMDGNNCIPQIKIPSLHPLEIVRQCQVDGVPSYEVRWEKLALDNWTTEDGYCFAIDIEPFRRIYRDSFIARFEAAKMKSKKVTKKTKKSAASQCHSRRISDRQTTLDRFVKSSQKKESPAVFDISILFEELGLGEKERAKSPSSLTKDSSPPKPYLNAFSDHRIVPTFTNNCMDMLLNSSLLSSTSPSVRSVELPNERSLAPPFVGLANQVDFAVDEFRTPPPLRERLMKFR